MACCIPIALSRMSRWAAVLPCIRLVCCLRDSWVTFLHMNFLVNLFVKGRVEGTGRQGRRCKQLLDDCKEKEDTVN